MAVSIDGNGEVSGIILDQADMGPNVVGNGPAFSALKNSNQVLPANAWTKVLFDKKEIDTNICFDTVNGRFVPNIAGYYFIKGQVTFVEVNATYMCAAIYKNGVQIKQGDVTQSTGPYSSGVEGLVYLNGQGDYVELWAQGASISPTVTPSFFATYFDGFMVRAAQ